MNPPTATVSDQEQEQEYHCQFCDWQLLKFFRTPDYA